MSDDNTRNILTFQDGLSDPANLYYALKQKQASRRRILIQILLFVLTIISTTLFNGFAYSVPLMLILLFHEMGHYFAARYYRVPATLPYFIPFPLSIFGTFGAVIKMQGIIPNRRALFDIGIMGPALGVLVALPATIVGISLSTVIDSGQSVEHLVSLGDSILFSLISRLIHGPLPEGKDILLHPIGFAGWAGLFVTALNLLPMGQLDGGHIVYALFRRKSTLIYRTIFVAFAAFAIFNNTQWLFFLALVLFLIRLKHPPTLDEDLPIGQKRFLFGIVALIFFAITFPPVPFKLGS